MNLPQFPRTRKALTCSTNGQRPSVNKQQKGVGSPIPCDGNFHSFAIQLLHCSLHSLMNHGCYFLRSYSLGGKETPRVYDRQISIIGAKFIKRRDLRVVGCD